MSDPSYSSVHAITGRKVSPESLSQAVATASPVWGVRPIVSGIRTDLDLTPARLAQLLRDAELGYPQAYLELAEEMEERYLHYRGVLDTRKRAVAALEWSADAAGDAAQAKGDAELVASGFKKIKLREAVADAMDAVGKGFAVLQVFWDTSKRPWLPVRLEWCDPRWFSWGEDGRTPHLRDDGGDKPLSDYPYRFIVHTPHLKSGLPIRGGLARAVAWAYCFANFSLTDWVVFLEIYGQPLRLGKYDPLTAHSRSADIEVLEAAVRNLGSDASAVIPKDMMIEFIQSSARGNADLYENLLRYLDARVSILVLGQTGTTEGTPGRLGNDTAQQEVRYDILDADAGALGDTLSATLARWIVELNHGPREEWPTYTAQLLEPEDLDALAGQIAKLAPLAPEGEGIPWSWVREKWGIPLPRDGEAVLRPGAGSGGADGGGGGAGVAGMATKTTPAASEAVLRLFGHASRMRSGKRPEKPQEAISPDRRYHRTAQDAISSDARRGSAYGHPETGSCGCSAHAQAGEDWIDALAEELGGDWQPQLDPVLAPLLAAAEQSGSYAEFMEKLPLLLAQMDAQAVADPLTLATLASRAKGDMSDEQ
jgi:phage gp29-like protein